MRIQMAYIRRFVVALVVTVVLMAFPQNVRAADSQWVDVFYYEFDQEGAAEWAVERFEVCGGLDGDVLLWVRFANLFENIELGKVPCVTAGTRLLAVWVADGTLFVNVSREALSYGGGAGHERIFLGQIVRNAMAIECAGRLTILVEGAAVVWPEGSRTAGITLADWQFYESYY